MSDRKNWQPEEDEIIRRLVSEYTGSDSNRLKWTEIANRLNSEKPQLKRTGKQCRQRWHNQLNPDIKKELGWSQDEQKALFSAHNKLGNKWAQIALKIPGRTDNCVKNHFYSTLRKGMRRINKFISTFKRKETAIKEFKPIVLNKVLAVADNNYDSKLEVKNKALSLASDIKNQLIELAQENQQIQEMNTYEKDDIRERLLNNIQEFTRNCKKRKGKKKVNGQQEISQSEEAQQEESNRAEPSKKQKENDSTDLRGDKNLFQSMFSTEAALPDFKINKVISNKEEDSDKKKQNCNESGFKGFFPRGNITCSLKNENNFSEKVGFAPFQSCNENDRSAFGTTSTLHFLSSIPKVRRLPSIENGERRLEESGYIDMGDRQDLTNQLPEPFTDLIQSIELKNCPGRFGGLSGSIQFQRLLERSFPALGNSLSFSENAEGLLEPKKEKTSIISENRSLP